MQSEEQSDSSELAEILQVSSVYLTYANDVQSSFKVEISNCTGYFCDRCRRYTSSKHGEPCPRCSDVITKLLAAAS